MADASSKSPGRLTSQFNEFSAGPDLRNAPAPLPLQSLAQESDLESRLKAEIASIKERYGDPNQPGTIDPTKVNTPQDRAAIRQLLKDVGFNDKSAGYLNEVDPRLQIMAAEAKVNYDYDPRNRCYDKDGYVGHKSFQVQEIGGYRTVKEQNGRQAAGNSSANGNSFQSRHQWGQAFDFWPTEPVRTKNGIVNKPQKENHRLYPGYSVSGWIGSWDVKNDGLGGQGDFMRVAEKFVEAGKPYGLDEGDLRIKMNGNANAIGVHASSDAGHINVPASWKDQWYRDPRTGMIYIDGQQQPGTGIDPKMHPGAGPTYATTKPPAPSTGPIFHW